MYDEQSILEKSLEPNVAEIYLILAQNGELTVPQIGQYTEFSRTIIYECLSDLLAKDFLDYRKEGRKAFYKIKHPGKLMDLAEDKKREASLFSDELSNVVKSLTGVYNLTENKPGVRFFEGIDGAKEALSDSLNSQETVYAFVDVDAVKKYVDAINKAHVRERIKNGVKKRLLVLDTPLSRKYLKDQGDELTEFRFLPASMGFFHTGMEIYDNKISYFTLREDNIIAVILEDKDIYQLNRNLFELLWNLSEDKKNLHSNEDFSSNLV